MNGPFKDIGIGYRIVAFMEIIAKESGSYCAPHVGVLLDVICTGSECESRFIPALALTGRYLSVDHDHASEYISPYKDFA